MRLTSKPTAWQRNYDERQLRIRGDCYMHGFLAMCGMLIAEWLFPPPAGFLSHPSAWNTATLLVGLAVVIAEMVLRDVFFGLRDNRRGVMTVLMVLASAGLWLGAIWSLASTGPWSGGGPTGSGAALADAVIFTAVPVSFVIRAIANRRARAEG
jgi:cation transport ATPase